MSLPMISHPPLVTSPSLTFHHMNNIKAHRHKPLMLPRCCLAEKHARKLSEAKAYFTSMITRKQGTTFTCPVETLVMVDTVQRLGIDHHFHEHIEALLNHELITTTTTTNMAAADELFEVALSFRLFREQGHHVPSDRVFDKFMKNGGGEGMKYFDPRLRRDVEALMELFEASQWVTPGESTLHESGEFSARWLRSWITKSSSSSLNVPVVVGNGALVGQLATAEAVANTLKHPCRRSIPRLAIKGYLSSFEARVRNHEVKKDNYVETLKDLAKLDFNVNQATHRGELLQISKWWNEIGLAENHGREHLQVEAYLWPMSNLRGPRFSECRIELAKVISFVYLIDDIFDTYDQSSLDQLSLFTQAVTRWDIQIAEGLPEYMRKCFMALHHMTNQMAHKVYERHGYNSTHSLQQAWAKLVEAFLVEAKWLRKGKSCPASEDYLKNGMVSSGVQLVLLHFFFLLGQGLTEQNVSLVGGDDPPLISAAAKILRLSDDLSSTYDGHVGYDASYVDCYLKENPGSSVAEGREHVMNMIEETWKQLNLESLATAGVLPKTFTTAVVDSARMVPFVYGNNEGSFRDDCSDKKGSSSTVASLEGRIKSLLFESIPI